MNTLIQGSDGHRVMLASEKQVEEMQRRISRCSVLFFVKPSKNDMEQKTYYLDTGNDRVYFNVIGSETVCRDTTSRVSEDKLITFLQTAQELGLKAGSL